MIQIGSADYTIIGPHTYTLTYTIVIPEDYHSDLDFIYYSVLGNNWDTTISHFSFDIQFEKALTENEMSNIKVFSGSLGNQSNDLNVTPINYFDFYQRFCQRYWCKTSYYSFW